MNNRSIAGKISIRRFYLILIFFFGGWLSACQNAPVLFQATPTKTPHPIDPHWLFINPYMKAFKQNDQATMDRLVSENQKEVPTAIDEMIETSNMIEGKMEIGAPGEEGVFYKSDDYILAAESMANGYLARSGDEGPGKKVARERMIDHARSLYLDAEKFLKNGGDIQQTRQQVIEALEIFRSLQDAENEAAAMHYLGYLYLIDKDKGKAVEYSEQAAQIAEKAGFYDREAVILSELAIFYLVEPKDPEKSWIAINKALQVAEKTGNTDTINQVKETYKKLYGKEP